MIRSSIPVRVWLSAILAIASAVSASVSAQERVTVSKVLDHSTIVVSKNEKITLIGVDKPPTGAFTARDAKDHLDEILRGKEVMLVADPNVADAKGAKSRYIYLNGDLVNQRVISEGFAGVRRGGEFTKLEAFLEAENVARRMKIGAWILDGSTTDEQFSMTITPNPMSEVAMLQYQIPEPCNVSLLILDSTNRVVASLVNARMEQGAYTAVFQRLRLPDGRYRCQLSAGSRVVSENLTLVGRGATTVAATADGVDIGTAPTAVPVERKSFRLPGGGGTHTTAKP
ncbi:MAG TPA: thermonuclease family protein [Candidatus Kapabacteria bacterium]|nr:thermonuclease family protein [Candidatus Kapabacteria bacterium]